MLEEEERLQENRHDSLLTASSRAVVDGQCRGHQHHQKSPLPNHFLATPPNNHHHYQQQQQQQQQHQEEEPTSTAASISSHSSLTTTFNTASLIQSAARSVLDSVYTPTSTNVSDDEDDSDHRNDQQRRRRQTLLLVQPTLDSLQTRKIPAMPDGQDRKRFVGCFAAILASAHEYDVAHEIEDTHANRAESYAYLSRKEQGQNDSEEEEGDEGEDQYYAASTVGGTLETNATSKNTFLQAEEEEEYVCEDSFLSHSCSTSFEYADYSEMDISLSQIRPTHTSRSTRNQSTQSQSQKPLRRETIKKCTLARNRHRKRRYDVLSKLLLSSAELLLLEKSQARAFLPMLARLLVPPTASEKLKSDRIRQRKQQLQRRKDYQQQEELQQQRREDEMVSRSQTSTPTKPHISPFVHSPDHTATTSTTTTSPTSSSSISASAAAVVVAAAAAVADKGVNRYHFSPSSSLPQSQSRPLPPEEYSTTATDNDNTHEFVANELDDEEHLKPFLESLSPGAGYRCLTLLLLQHLLNSTEGYDARIRHVIKKLGVTVLIHDMELEQELEIVDDEASSQRSNKSQKKRRRRPRQRGTTREGLVGPATRKFEALEHSIAVRLIRLSKEQERFQKQRHRHNSSSNQNRDAFNRRTAASKKMTVVPAGPMFSREQLIRGLKIGSAGLVAGTIFAVTGGLAAPGIAAGVAAIAGSTAATAAIATIVSSTAAVTTIFGVGGGSLAAYKMNRRTQGLTDFEFRRQDKLLPTDKKLTCEEDEEEQAELFSTVCISGWLNDEHDFMRPWGIAPNRPRIQDRLELLERFYAIYRPDHVCKCKKILASWQGEEGQLWELLKQKYGRDPDSLYPIVSSNENGFHRGLTLEQEEVLNELFVELGYVQNQSDISQPSPSAASKHSTFENVRERLAHTFTHTTTYNNSNNKNNNNINNSTSYSGNFEFFSTRATDKPYRNVSALLDEPLQGRHGTDGRSCASSGFDSLDSSQLPASASHNGGDETEEYVPPKHLATVWDYHSKYGGELYTVKWESEMLIELCDSVTDLAFDVINGATAQILRQTALHTLISAVAVPYALINAANLIDGPWTLAVERADEAGKELAKSLLFSRAGYRPVTLVGFSFGARAIYSCLKELAKYQEKWEASREKIKNQNGGTYHEDDPNQTADNGYPCVMREPASIVEDAIMMGLPNHLSLTSWKACRQVVGGRLINCYSRKDLILSLMFQFKRLAGVLRPVCGTCIVDVPGVENVDVSDLISSHQDYCIATGEILKRVRHGEPFRTSVSVGGVPSNASKIGA